MVTASHNPKADNGYKVYWNNGSQIVPPHDAGIAGAIDQNLAPWQKYDTTTETIMGNTLTENATVRIAEAYYQSIITLCEEKEKNASNPVKAVYTGKFFLFVLIKVFIKNNLLYLVYYLCYHINIVYNNSIFILYSLYYS